MMREVRGHCAGTRVQRSEERQDERQFNEPAWRHEPVDLLLAAPFIALLWVPFYNSFEPKLGEFRSSIGTSFFGSSSRRA